MSTAEIKYPKRFLDLNMNSPVEDSKLAYDEMAACWEKVTMTTSFENFTFLQILSEYVCLRMQLLLSAFGRFASCETPNRHGTLKDEEATS